MPKNSVFMKAAALGAGVWLLRRLARKDFDFFAKTVIITGGSRGLGLVLARQWAEEGARVVVCARDAAELDRARRDLSWHGHSVLALTCDITRKDEVDALVETVRDYFGRIDVLVNNAGVIEVGPQDTMSLEDYEEALRVHFWGPLHMITAVLPEMRRRRSGRIVNIASIGGKISFPHLLPYNASKFALVGLSEGLRVELAKDGVCVTTVCPGLMRTGSPHNALFKGRHRAEYAWFSLGDALPVASMSAERAARQIIQACRRGEVEIVLSLPARLAVRFKGIFPGLMADLLALANRVLPGAGGVGAGRMKGKESYSFVSPSWLTRLNDRAALKNNEVSRPEDLVRK